MKRMVCAVMALLLTGCAAGQVRSSAPVTDGRLRLPPKPPPRRRQPKVLPAPAPTTAPPQGLVPTDADVLDYDDIRFIAYERAFQPYPETDYYTMCKDGLWGLMRSDGTEVLPCRAPQPLVECFIEGRRWHGYQDNLPWDEMLAEEKRINVLLRESGDGMLWRGPRWRHLSGVCLPDGLQSIYIQRLNGPGRIGRADRRRHAAVQRPGGRLCAGPDRRNGRRGRRTTSVLSVMDNTFTAAAMAVRQTSTTTLLPTTFLMPRLAPAEREGKWVYLGTMGEEVTPVCYDSVYYTNTSGDGSFLFRRAAPLLNGAIPP